MQRSVVLNIVGLTDRLIGEYTPNISSFCQERSKYSVKPVFPALTCTAQSTYLTGKDVKDHGIVANGWYSRDLAEHQFWKQSNHLVKGPKVWDILREENSAFTCAKVFWWYNMYSTADYSITPRPIYPSDGSKVFDVYTNPMAMRDEIKTDLGAFPFQNFWGPLSGIESTKWIAESAKWIEEKHSPTLSLVYLPHLDYCLQKDGPNAAVINSELSKIDLVFKDLHEFYAKKNIKITILSEYGITPVDKPIHLNRIFREKGWITIKNELGLEMIDLGASKAFAVADHQVAHVYVNDLSVKDQVAEILRSVDGVEKVLSPKENDPFSIDHERGGDFVVISDSRSWFTYYYWNDDALAPDFARCVDIHRKPGYDPVELFFDPSLKFLKLRAAYKLIRKKLGFRTIMDFIPLDASLVKGSHGRIPTEISDWPVFISDSEFEDITNNTIDSKLVFEGILNSVNSH